MRERIAAIALADARIRFRRTSTVVVFLLLSGLAYLWVPAPSTGRSLMIIGGARALYNSAAIAMATAILGTLFIGLAGFYVISNAVRRDAQSRVGAIIAATPLRSGEYIAGKFAGNVLFLTTFFFGFMLVSMAMVVVRGEAPLEPWTFVVQYLLLAPPPILFVSALAILFECIPWLSGRFGDVAYFFLFLMSMGITTAMVASGGMAWASYFDPSGLSAVFAQNSAMLHTKSIAIGASPFDPRKPPIVYPGLAIGGSFVAQRLVAMLIPLPLLLLARVSFHRFDPVRIRVAAKAERRWLARLNALLKPLTRALLRMPAARSLPLAAVADAQLTLASAPWIAIAIVAAAASRNRPFAFLAMAIAIADVATRDVRFNTVTMLYAAPRLREHFVAWKAMSASIVALLFVITYPSLATFAGAFFTVAAAVALPSPKAFIVLFLSFWYIVVNDKGATPALDFGGFYGKSPPSVALTYAAIGAAILAIAALTRRR
ncbi:MAG TPA: hypothetical protein VJZ76_22565 [Thermoanaerobaculia bacterium]|nr:hypothetical protein [Thermoanaerobaculia bacterium]